MRRKAMWLLLAALIAGSVLFAAHSGRKALSAIYAWQALRILESPAAKAGGPTASASRLQAAAKMEQALAVYPANHQVRHMLAYTLLDVAQEEAAQGRLRRAIEYCRQAGARDPALDAPDYDEGKLWERAGNLPFAEAAYRRALPKATRLTVAALRDPARYTGPPVVPSPDLPGFALAQVLAKQSRRGEALQVANRLLVSPDLRSVDLSLTRRYHSRLLSAAASPGAMSRGAPKVPSQPP